MKPAPFNYVAATSIPNAIELLEEHGSDAKIISGGQSLIPIMNFRLAQPKVLVDIGGLEDLAYIREEGEVIAIGATVRTRAVEMSALIREKCPLLTEAVPYIGHVPNRVRGTFCGSVAHGDPTAEIPVAVACLDAEIVVEGASGKKVYSPEDFFLSYLTTALEEEDVVTEVRIPTFGPNTRYSFLEQSRRHGDSAIVAVAVVLEMDGDRCTEAKFALGGVSDTPIRAEDAEELLAGQQITDALLEEAAEAAAESTDPDEDMHASADYRQAMARVFTLRALRNALGKDGEGSE